jgi:hypothetical protein
VYLKCEVARRLPDHLPLVDLDSSEVNLFERILAWKRSRATRQSTPDASIDPPFDYGAVDRLQQPQTHLGKEQRKQVEDQYRAGIAIKTVAATFGIHRKTVREIAAAAGLDPHPRGLQEEDLPRAAALYRSGWSLARVGDELGVNASTVMTALKRDGVQMRPRQGGRRGRTDTSVRDLLRHSVPLEAQAVMAGYRSKTVSALLHPEATAYLAQDRRESQHDR